MDSRALQNKTEKIPDNRQQEILQKAEAMLEQSAMDLAGMSIEDIRDMVFRFQVRQLEMEMLKEELNEANKALAASRDHYTQLYNARTIGYLTLNEDGIIQHANLAAAMLLDCPQKTLTNKKLGELIYPADQDAYYFFMQDFASQNTDKILTVRLNLCDKKLSSLQCPGLRLTGCTQQSCSQNNPFIYVEFRHAANFNNSHEQHICLSINDISERKIIEESMDCHNEKLGEKVVRQTQELIGCNITKLIPVENRKKHNAFIQTQLHEVFDQIRTVEGIHKDGSLVSLDISLAEFVIDGVGYFTSIVRDVSLRKFKEQEDKAHLDELAHVTRLGLMGEMASGIAYLC